MLNIMQIIHFWVRTNISTKIYEIQ